MLGVVLPRGAELPPVDQASALAPQSSLDRVPLERGVVDFPPLLPAAQASAFSPHSLEVSPPDGLVFGVVLATFLLEVVEAQALVAAFQSSGSLLGGAAERDVVLEPFVLVDQESAAIPHSDVSVAGFLDEPDTVEKQFVHDLQSGHHIN